MAHTSGAVSRSNNPQLGRRRGRRSERRGGRRGGDKGDLGEAPEGDVPVGVDDLCHGLLDHGCGDGDDTHPFPSRCVDPPVDPTHACVGGRSRVRVIRWVGKCSDGKRGVGKDDHGNGVFDPCCARLARSLGKGICIEETGDGGKLWRRVDDPITLCLKLRVVEVTPERVKGVTSIPISIGIDGRLIPLPVGDEGIHGSQRRVDGGSAGIEQRL